ncbi:hypothetical protein HHK36_011228 [Tetracentron sinense]|uniref:Lysosomal Pro-X carboxypeptidase n=1 Tax=Tetracentron sinense TaxID=13715 RepID=A0A834ZFV3_TETSI|nr:hypothetical protein HHK36_011228 [Tetracentron sinense]
MYPSFRYRETQKEMGSFNGVSSVLLLSWLLVLLLCTEECLSRIPSLLGRPRGRYGRTHRHPSLSPSTLKDFQTLYYDQTLDHFNYRPESYTTFRQKYVVNSKYWNGSNNSSPIFVYIVGEWDLTEGDYTNIVADIAPQYQALLVYIEHRYYGESLPFGSRKEAYRNASNFGYLSIDQALADLAEIITYLRKNYSAEHCPVIVYGGSYAGMLASWFRLKYPHIAMGAWASSAPILDFSDINPRDEYNTIVTKDFREASEDCYNTIKESWAIIDKIGSHPKGLKYLSKKFKTCSRLNTSEDLRDFLCYTFEEAAQYDAPPDYPVNTICNAIDGLPPGTEFLTRIFAGINATLSLGCYNTTPETDASLKMDPWTWQACTELMGSNGQSTNVTMFPQNYRPYISADQCMSLFGIPERPHWLVTEFGGQDIKLILKRFGSNIIFSNGLRDPYSVGGVLEDISDSIVAIKTTQGSHCLDMYSLSPNDPDWLASQKKKILHIIEGWMKEYHAVWT